MKLNWGQSIALVMFAFIIFILSFVYKTFTNSKYDHHLVSEEYYKDEMNYQQEIDAVNNAKNLKTNVFLETVSEGIRIVFPKEVINISGNIAFQRASNVKLDFEKPITLVNNEIIIPKNKLVEGSWNVKIKWKANNVKYLFKEKYYY